MLTSLGGGLLSLFSRRFVLTIWLPTLLFWVGIGALAVTSTGWHQGERLWLRQPIEFKFVLAGLALAWVTFFSYLFAAQLPWGLRMAEGYWPQRQPWLWLARIRREAHAARQATMSGDPAALARFYLDYPARQNRVMPTKLGNVLRSAEDHAQERYHINTVIIWPRLYVLLPDRFIAALAAARAQLDLMTAMTVLSGLFAIGGPVISFIFLPWYAAVACFAGGLATAWLSYLGAVRACYPYGQLIRAAFDVYRGLLLDEMHWTRPSSYGAERRQWEQIGHLWYQGSPDYPSGAALLGYPRPNSLSQRTRSKYKS